MDVGVTVDVEKKFGKRLQKENRQFMFIKLHDYISHSLSTCLFGAGAGTPGAGTRRRRLVADRFVIEYCVIWCAAI